MFAADGSEDRNSSVCHAAAVAAGTDPGLGASLGIVRWHAVAVHDGAGPVCDDAGVDVSADGVGVDHGVGAGDQEAHAISPIVAEKIDKTRQKNNFKKIIQFQIYLSFK